MNGQATAPVPAGFGDGLRQIRMAVDLLSLHDWENAAALIGPLLHPEVRALGAPGLGPARSSHGREEFLEFFADAAAQGVLLHSDASEIRFAPSGAMLITATVLLTGPGVSDTTPAWFVLTFRDGLIASLGVHLSRKLAEDALA